MLTMKKFDPNAAAPQEAGIFGLPFSVEEAKLVLLPVPWEATTSYGGGTSKGPEAILQASKQVDLFDIDMGNFFEAGIAMIDISQEVQQWNRLAQEQAQLVIEAGGDANDPALRPAIDKVNAYSAKVNDYVYTETKRLLSQGKLAGLVGGDHSTPFGAIQAFLEKYPQMGILHIDAHADLREAFEGFEYSHASIMHNVITKTPLKKLVQVGIRDFCEEEFNFIRHHSGRITTSFDIDGLDPRFCPHTGTPVPGGLEFREVLYLLKKIVKSGRSIIGFDLNEVSLGEVDPANVTDPSGEWDANVGARLLYKLCGWTLTSAI